MMPAKTGAEAMLTGCRRVWGLESEFMGFETDSELLEEFLSETCDILAQLEVVLRDPAQRSVDCDLPGAVCRGFHTVKGGAGFFGLDDLVEICRLVEGAFNRLCQGQGGVDARLLDLALQALEQVKEMVAVLRRGEQPLPAGAALLSQLKEFNEAGRPFAKISRA